MSRIDDLIASLAPNGVAYRRVGDVAEVGTGSSDRKDAHPDGKFPFYVRSKEIMKIDSHEFDETAIIIPGEGGIGDIFHFADGKYALHQRAYRISFRTAEIDPKFAYYYFSTHFKRFIMQKAVSATVTSIRKPMVTDFPIALPPLEVQREIVRILDQFTQLEAELEAELEARRVQYVHYRDTQLTFPESTQRVLLGDVGSIFGGLTGKSKADFANGNARFVSYVNVFNNIAVNTHADDFVQVGPQEKQRSLQRGDIIFTGSSETADEVGMSSVVTADVSEPLYLNSFCIGFRPTDNDLIDPDFAKHLFRSGEMRKQIVRTASGVTRFNVSKARLAKVELPIPPKDEQRRISSVLDGFDALVNDLSTGLPAELRARRKQYEYYRDKLLTFEELPA